MITYLIINTGYTARILEHLRQKRKEIEKKPLFIWDELWGLGLTRFGEGGDEDIQKIKECFEDIREIDFGTICYKYEQDEEFDPIGIVKSLIEMDYCGFFFINRPYGKDTKEIDPETNEPFDDPMDLEEAKQLGMREICNNDLNDFEGCGDTHNVYEGTLCEVRIIQQEDFKIVYLTFDCESG